MSCSGWEFQLFAVLSRTVASWLQLRLSVATIIGATASTVLESQYLCHSMPLSVLRGPAQSPACNAVRCSHALHTTMTPALHGRPLRLNAAASSMETGCRPKEHLTSILGTELLRSACDRLSMWPTAMLSLHANVDVDVDVVTCRPHLQSVSHSTHTRQVPFVGTKEAERDLQSGTRPGISAPVMREEQPSVLVLPTGHSFATGPLTLLNYPAFAGHDLLPLVIMCFCWW